MAGLLHPPMLSCSCNPVQFSRKSTVRGNPSFSQGQPHVFWGSVFFIIIFSHRAEACEVVSAAFLISKFWTK